MKNFIALALFICIAAGCRKKRDTCYNSYSHIGGAVAFKGFTAADLDTIIVKQYAKGGGFTQLNNVASLNALPFSFQNDTALSADGFAVFGIDDGQDYEIILPSIGRTIRITGVTYHGAVTFAYSPDNDGYCWMKTTLPASPDSLAVDQVPTIPGHYHGSQTFTFLVK